MPNIPQNDAGLAFSDSDTFTQVTLHTGAMPQVTTSEVVAAALVASVDLPAYSVVGRNAGGELVMAVWDAVAANNVRPIGITTTTVKAGATAKNVAVWRDGVFNPDALNWHASFDTDLKKRLAFELSQQTIFLRKPTFTA